MKNVKGITVEIRKTDAKDLVIYLLNSLVDTNKLEAKEQDMFIQIKSCIKDFHDNAEILDLIANYEGKDRIR